MKIEKERNRYRTKENENLGRTESISKNRKMKNEEN